MRVLYIVYWGALEQLGRSLVIPTVKRLAAEGADLTLITFEKPEDLNDVSEVVRVAEMFERCGVDWKPLKYHKTPKIPAMALDSFQGVAFGVAKRLRGKFDVVHARTFQAGLIGLVLAPLIRAKFIYHNEGYYPDEQVDAGVWGSGSKPHRYSKKLETMMYRRSDAVIALSSKSVEEIKELNPKVRVVPSCVDLEMFKLQPRTESSVFRFVYLGSVGGRYDLRGIAIFVAKLKEGGQHVELKIFSKAERGLIAEEIDGTGLSSGDYSVESLRYDQVPEKLGECDAGIHFLKPGIAEHAGSPTKIGEYWAVGLPVVMTAGMGDTDNIAIDESVGAVYHPNQSELDTFSVVQKLVKNPAHREYCRNAAKRHYGLDNAVTTQFDLYQELSV